MKFLIVLIVFAAGCCAAPTDSASNPASESDQAKSMIVTALAALNAIANAAPSGDPTATGQIAQLIVNCVKAQLGLLTDSNLSAAIANANFSVLDILQSIEGISNGLFLPSGNPSQADAQAALQKVWDAVTALGVVFKGSSTEANNYLSEIADIIQVANFNLNANKPGAVQGALDAISKVSNEISSALAAALIG